MYDRNRFFCFVDFSTDLLLLKYMNTIQTEFVSYKGKIPSACNVLVRPALSQPLIDKINGSHKMCISLIDTQSEIKQIKQCVLMWIIHKAQCKDSEFD